MFLVDIEQGRIIDDEELKHEIASAASLRQVAPAYIDAAREPARAAARPRARPRDAARSASRRSATRSRTSYHPRPDGGNGEEAIGSMGTDTPLAVLSDRPQPLFNYFKQLFAQVTNPPLDAIREELVTSVLDGDGPEGNLLEPTPESCRQIALETPILDNDELAQAQPPRPAGLQVGHVCRCSSRPPRAPRASRARWTSSAGRRAQAIDDGHTSSSSRDRGVDAEHAPIPSLLACAGLHHHLVREGNARRAPA